MSEPYRQAAPLPTLPPTKKHCHACASILDVRAEICPGCGVRQVVMGGALVVTGPTAMASGRNKTAAGCIALLLGGIGIHKFYLGQTAAGILYLLFCWTFIPSLIALVEGIILLTMSDEAFAAKYP